MNAEELLRGCPPDIREKIAERAFQKGEIIMLQGQQDECVYILLAGAVRVFNLFPNGISYQQRIYTAVTFLGEIELFAGIGNVNMVEAMEHCETLMLDRETFLSWVDRDKVLCRTLLASFADRIVDLNKRSMRARRLTNEEHFLFLLLRADFSRERFTRQMIEEQLAVSPRTVSRLIHDAVSEGIIRMENGMLVIADKEKLTDKCTRMHLSVE